MAYSVLVVEDDDSLRMLECEALESLGLVVHDSKSADDALVTLERLHGTDLVITDMPGRLDGTELARIIDDRWPFIAVMFKAVGMATPATA